MGACLVGTEDTTYKQEKRESFESLLDRVKNSPNPSNETVTIVTSRNYIINDIDPNTHPDEVRDAIQRARDSDVREISVKHDGPLEYHGASAVKTADQMLDEAIELSKTTGRPVTYTHGNFTIEGITPQTSIEMIKTEISKHEEIGMVKMQLAEDGSVHGRMNAANFDLLPEDQQKSIIDRWAALFGNGRSHEENVQSVKQLLEADSLTQEQAVLRSDLQLAAKAVLGSDYHATFDGADNFLAQNRLTADNFSALSKTLQLDIVNEWGYMTGLKDEDKIEGFKAILDGSKPLGDPKIPQDSVQECARNALGDMYKKLLDDADAKVQSRASLPAGNTPVDAAPTGGQAPEVTANSADAVPTDSQAPEVSNNNSETTPKVEHDADTSQTSRHHEHDAPKVSAESDVDNVRPVDTHDAGVDGVKTKNPDVIQARMSAGGSAAGLVMAGMGLHHAIIDGDVTGMLISGTDLGLSTADLAMDIYAASGGSISNAVLGGVAKVNLLVMLGDAAYQISREEGYDNKLLRLASIGVTTGAAIKTGVAASTIVGGTAVATVGAPILVAVGVGLIGDAAIDGYKVTESLNDAIAAEEKIVRRGDDVEPSGAPKLDNFMNLTLFAVREGGVPDGVDPNMTAHEKAMFVKSHEYSNDPEALDDLEDRIKSKIEEYDKIIEENSSFFFHDSLRFLGGDEIDVKRKAQIERTHYASALKELKEYRNEVQDFKDAKWASHFNPETLLNKSGLAKTAFATASSDVSPNLEVNNDYSPLMPQSNTLNA